MIKLILEIASLDYDDFLGKLLQAAKEHPEMLGGAKLPPFSDKMLKMVPPAQKHAIFAGEINKNKDRMLPQAEMMLARFIGPVKIYDLSVICGEGGRLTVSVELANYDSSFMIDQLLPRYYDEVSGPQVMGSDYMGSYRLDAVQQHMRMQDFRGRQLLIAKSMSQNKQKIMRLLESGASANGIFLTMDNMRFMVR